jgi:hypothetical protein
MLERLRDPAMAAAYINAAAHEDDPGAFLQALRNVAEARGGYPKSQPAPASIGNSSIARFPAPAIRNCAA